MEYINGGDLIKFINNKGRLTESEALYYFGQIIDAFRCLRATDKIVHRDVKPENILVQISGTKITLKLTDCKIKLRKLTYFSLTIKKIYILLK
jgi:serine/threonine protein kinase